MSLQFTSKPWWSRCDVFRETVPDHKASRSKWAVSNSDQSWWTNVKSVGRRWPQPAPRRHVGGSMQLLVVFFLAQFEDWLHGTAPAMILIYWNLNGEEGKSHYSTQRGPVTGCSGHWWAAAIYDSVLAASLFYRFLPSTPCPDVAFGSLTSSS